MSRLYFLGMITALGAGAATTLSTAVPATRADDETVYSQDFEAPDALDAMTVINSNNDFKKWEWKNSCAWLQYNGQEPSDDWLITPGLQLTEGFVYKVRFQAWAHIGNAYPERIEVKYGKSATAEGMTGVLLSPTLLTNKEDERQLFECSFTADSDATYYIGFHGISDRDQSGLFLDNIVVSVTRPTVPCAPEDFLVKGDPMGSNRADISFKAPTADMTGAPLESIDRIELLREEELIHTFEHPAPGETLTYTDLGAERGMVTYHAVPYTADGAGMEAFMTAFIGVNTPAPCPSVKVVESSSKPGQVTVSWEEPLTDVDGNPINRELITYEVVERRGYWSQTVIKSDIKGTSYTYQAVPVGDPQEFKQWGVYAYTANGTKHDTRTGNIPVGTPYGAPYAESFADGAPATIVSSDSELETGQWEYYTDETAAGMHAQDGDNGFVGIVTSDTETPASLALGKVSLAGLSSPGLSFYLYNPEGAMGAILDEVDVQVFTAGAWDTILTVALSDLALTDNWNRVMVSLDEFKDKTVQVRFVARVQNGGMILLDNIYIGELYTHNLAATSVAAPAMVKPDTDFKVGVTVANLGTERASGYEVTLMRNGIPVATLPGTPVEVCDEAVVTFTDRVNVAADDVLHYQATVSYDADQNPADNTSRRGSATLQRSLLPAPYSLEAASDGTSVALTWTEPDTTHTDGATVTESFELADSWAIDDVDGWTFIDADGSETVSLQSFTYPGKNEKMAYQVFDRASKPFTTETGFDAVSGTKYLAAFCAASGRNDDWAISPRLSGNAQTVTLNVSSFSAAQGYEYLETFEFLYSTGGTSSDDFKILARVENVPAEWTEYQFLLPEGALYFAIRCVSEDKFIFMVDDVTYEPDVLGGGVTLLGYNVYRDAERINAEPVAATSFTDSAAPAGEHTYVVSAVYSAGESGISNLAVAEVEAGVASIGAEAAGISVDGGRVLYSGPGEARIFSADGRAAAVVASGTGAALPSGVYIALTPQGAVKIRL